MGFMSGFQPCFGYGLPISWGRLPQVELVQAFSLTVFAWLGVIRLFV
jgi:hypothetical protein